MENITVLKRFVRNAAIMLLIAGVMYTLIHYSEIILGNPAYPFVALFTVVLVWMLWGMSVSQLESEAREQQEKDVASRKMLNE